MQGSPSVTSGHQEHSPCQRMRSRTGRQDAEDIGIWAGMVFGWLRGLSAVISQTTEHDEFLCVVTDTLKSFCAAPVASGRGHGRETLAHDGS